MRWSEMTPRQRDAALSGKQGWSDIHKDELGGWIGLPPGYLSEYPVPVPYYTTDDAAALELAEWMRGKEWSYIIKGNGGAGGFQFLHRPYCCELERDGESSIVYAGTLAAAISEAVWLAQGGER